MIEQTVPVERDQRDTQILHARIQGVRLVELGERWGLTPEGVRHVFGRAAKRHLKKVTRDMHAAQRSGGVLALTIKGETAEELAEGARFSAWLIESLVNRGVDVDCRLVHLADGIVISLWDRNYLIERIN